MNASRRRRVSKNKVRGREFSLKAVVENFDLVRDPRF
jgi:hypothetical protein